MSPEIYPLSGCCYLCLHFAQSTPGYRYRVRLPPPLGQTALISVKGVYMLGVERGYGVWMESG